MSSPITTWLCRSVWSQEASKRPSAARTIQRAWRRYFCLVTPRRQALARVLGQYTFQFAIQARILRRRRAIRSIRNFFNATAHLSKSYMTSVIRNFRRSVVTLQNFWRSMMWKMEVFNLMNMFRRKRRQCSEWFMHFPQHQLLIWMIQWLNYEEKNCQRIKDGVEHSSSTSTTANMKDSHV